MKNKKANKNHLKQRLLILSISLTLICSPVTAQQVNSYTLDSLQSMARTRYPQARQLILVSLKEKEALKNINSNWLPKTVIAGSTTLQSEVTKLSLPSTLPISIESPEKDQYKAGIELSQLIFDGGVCRTQKTIEKLNTKAETNKIECDLLKVKDQINDLFLGILINKESFNALSYIKKDLTERHRNIESSVQSGMMLTSSMRELEAEIIGINQKMIENKSQLCTICSTLSIIVQEKIDTSTVFIVPKIELVLTENIENRPEYKQLTTQMELFEWRTRLIKNGCLPKIALFGNGYYGRSGLNFFNNDFRTYGMAGINMSWNIGGNYTSISQKKQLHIEKKMVENQRTLFELGMQTQIIRQKQEIAKLKDLIIQDDTVTAIRREIKQVAAIQYENGTITTTDYFLKLNAETQAMINQNIHKIQLAMANIKYKTIIGE